MMLDENALIATILAERRMVLRRVARRVHAAFAEDVAQEVLSLAVVLVRKGRLAVAEDSDVRGAVRAWLTEVIRHVCARHVCTESAGWIRRVEGQPEANVDLDPTRRIEAREQLRRVVIGLSRREVETLHVFAQGATIAETAAVLGIPAGSAATRIRTIRRYLRQRQQHEERPRTTARRTCRTT